MKTIDLTHPITHTMPVWPGDPHPVINMLSTVKEGRFLLNQLSIGEHTGTHFGVPAHFIDGGLTADRVPPEALIAPGVVVDIHHACIGNPDYTLTIEDILNWETKHGILPPRSYLLAMTGWSEIWPEPERYFGFSGDGTMHYPGFSQEVVVFLMEQRCCLGLGIDTHGIDPGYDDHCLSNTALFQHGGYHLENLTNLARLPFRNFTLFIGLLPLTGGSGSPAKVLACYTENKRYYRDARIVPGLSVPS